MRSRPGRRRRLVGRHRGAAARLADHLVAPPGQPGQGGWPSHRLPACGDAGRDVCRDDRRRWPARPARRGQAARGLAPRSGPARDRRPPARSRPHSAPALLRQPDRVLLDLVGRRSPDRRYPVWLSRLPARSDGDRARGLRELQRLHVRERDHHRGGASWPPDAGGHDRGVLSARRAAEPLPGRPRHDQDHRHGRRRTCSRSGCTCAVSGAACNARPRRC